MIVKQIEDLRFSPFNIFSDRKKVSKCQVRMSIDIGPILSRAGRSSERLVLGQLLSSASLASLQTYLSGLLGRCDHFDGAACLLILLRHDPGLARDSGEKLMSVLTKTFHRPGVSPELQGVVCQCLVQVIQNSVNSSDTGKAISSSTPSLVTTILSVVSGQQSVRLTSTCLTLLAVLMSRYSGSCGQLRPKIMEMLISHLDTVRSRGGRVQQLGRCFSLVCQVGGGGREGVEHSAHHNSLLASLVSTVHSGLNTLLAGIKELDTFPDVVAMATPWALKEISLEQLSWKLENCMSVISQLLLRGFPQSRRVSVDSLLSLPVRLLGVSIDPRKVNTPQDQLVTSLLSMLCSSSLQMTSALVTCLGEQLLPEAGRINSLIVSGLSRIRGSRVRTELYTCLSTWLECAGLGSGVEYCAGQLLASLITDIVPTTQKMMLQTTSTSSKGNKRKKGNNNSNFVSNQTNSTTNSADSTMSLAAVKALGELVSVAGPWLDKESHTGAMQCVLSQLMVAEPEDPLTQGLLYCLHGLVASTSPQHKSPVQIALPVVSRFLGHELLSTQAKNLLRTIHSLTHPSRLTMDVQDCKTVALNNIHTPEIEETKEHLEIADTSTQTENILEVKAMVNGEGERIQKLESALNEARLAESAVRAEILRRDIEISRLKGLSEKRSHTEIGASNDSLSPSKKAKTHHQLEVQPSPQAEIFPTDQSNGEGQLSVEDMMKDFSDKLNDNIVPRNFTNDSDSE